MKRRKMRRERSKSMMLIAFLFLFAVGIGYALLTEQLTIDNTVSYDAMKWNIGFTATSDGGGTITAESAIDVDMKTLIVTCDFGTNTSSEVCIAKATITNDSSFYINLNSAPTITFDNTYISSALLNWVDDSTTVASKNVMAPGASKEVKLQITSKELTVDMLPSSDISIPITLTLNWQQAEEISFVINSTAYTAIEGMTWNEWVDSEYNVDGVVISSIADEVGTNVIIADEVYATLES